MEAPGAFQHRCVMDLETLALANSVYVPRLINHHRIAIHIVCPILSLRTAVLHVLAMLQGTPCASRAESEVQLARKQGDTKMTDVFKTLCTDSQHDYRKQTNSSLATTRRLSLIKFPPAGNNISKRPR